MTRHGDPLLGIGAFARRSRLSPKALRLYDRLGLLPPAYVDDVSGYRWYREDQVASARLIVLLRRLDMPLADVALALSMPDSDAAQFVASYWNRVERRVAGQRELAAHLRIRLDSDEGNYEMYDVQHREVPQQTVLTEQRHLLVDGLSAWLDASIGRLQAAAQRLGGPAGPPFVIYHGEVTEDSDGPVETCLPVDPAGVSAEDTTRSEPAHREAYVRVRKAQVQYPQILSAYDAVATWIKGHGEEMAGSPREIYFGDFDAAGPDDEVCDVAWPVR